ncbi:MAG: hypothetical protein K2H64_11610 [Desulfovibrio sp.]|nr:hypothetical protein [Desulfovibrio sp.]
MGRMLDFEDEPFEEKVKTLEDEELLEIWAESQQAEQSLLAQFPDAELLPKTCEQVIVTELFIRASRRLGRC